MKTNKIIFSFLILSTLTFLLAGCLGSKKNIDIVSESELVEQHQSDTASKRFQENTQQSQTIVDSAMSLAKKYAELSEEKAALQQSNSELLAENSRLENRVAMIEPQLEKANKNLDEANDLLIEMRLELNNWKVDILGYREEMRDASTAQMEILIKIAQAMGAELVTDQNENEHSIETSDIGESNE